MSCEYGHVFVDERLERPICLACGERLAPREGGCRHRNLEVTKFASGLTKTWCPDCHQRDARPGQNPSYVPPTHGARVTVRRGAL